MSILVSKILATEGFPINQIFENRGKVYSFLNPVSYLTALDNKDVYTQEYNEHLPQYSFLSVHQTPLFWIYLKFDPHINANYYCTLVPVLAI